MIVTLISLCGKATRKGQRVQMRTATRIAINASECSRQQNALCGLGLGLGRVLTPLSGRWLLTWQGDDRKRHHCYVSGRSLCA